jgi:hypothetical protein
MAADFCIGADKNTFRGSYFPPILAAGGTSFETSAALTRSTHDLLDAMLVSPRGAVAEHRARRSGLTQYSPALRR